jgi:hypothetical protein
MNEEADQITYFQSNEYTEDIFKKSFNLLPTYHRSGFVLVFSQSVHDVAICSIKATYYHKLISSYKTTPSGQDLEAKNSREESYKWSMCWQGRCYLMQNNRYIPESKSWSEAENFCVSEGGHLVSINSDAEQAMLIRWIMNRKHKITATLYRYSTIWRRSLMIYIGLRLNKV